MQSLRGVAFTPLVLLHAFPEDVVGIDPIAPLPSTAFCNCIASKLVVFLDWSEHLGTC